jgi:DNA ligase-4
MNTFASTSDSSLSGSFPETKERLHDWSSQAPLEGFCRMLNAVEQRKSTQAKKEIVERCIREWRRHSDDFFPILRLLLPHVSVLCCQTWGLWETGAADAASPQLDKERRSYNMKEVVLAKTFVEVLGLAKDSPDANSWIHWYAAFAKVDSVLLRRLNF